MLLPNSGQAADFRGVNGFVHFSAIRLEKRSLAGHFNLGGRGADRQFGVDTDTDSGVDPGGLAGKLANPAFLIVTA